MNNQIDFNYSVIISNYLLQNSYSLRLTHFTTLQKLQNIIQKFNCTLSSLYVL